jgi:IS1 family transposase
LSGGIGIRDVSAVMRISVAKVLKAPASTVCRTTLIFSYYDCLEADESWTYIRKKKNKVWLIYTCHRGSGEVVAYVWGKRDVKTARKLRRWIRRLGISYGRIARDNWDSFLSVFGEDRREAGTRRAVGIEGDDCRMRHRIRRVFRRICCFSKKLRNHWKAFETAFFYINYGFV